VAQRWPLAHMLALNGCRSRQRRLLQQMQERSWDLFLTADVASVYYFTGVPVPAGSAAAFFLLADGQAGLVSPLDVPAAADQIARLETYSIERAIDNPVGDAARILRDLLGSCTVNPLRCGVQLSSTPAVIESILRELWPQAGIEDAGPMLLRLRKRKEPDEIDEIRASLCYCAVAYDKAREVIRPSLTELDVHNALYDAVIQSAGSTIAFPGTLPVVCVPFEVAAHRQAEDSNPATSTFSISSPRRISTSATPVALTLSGSHRPCSLKPGRSSAMPYS